MPNAIAVEPPKIARPRKKKVKEPEEASSSEYTKEPGLQPGSYWSMKRK